MSETSLLPSETWTLSNPSLATFDTRPESVQSGRNGKVSQEEITQFCDPNVAADGLLLENGLFNRLTDGDRYPIENVNFTEEEEWSEGRTASGHKVEFGKLQVITRVGQLTTLDVAVKPFPGRKKAADEAAALIKVPAITEVPTFEVLGVIRAHNKIALLTRFEYNVRSLDNLHWSVGIKAPLRDSLDVVEALQKSALILARLHQVGAVHRDALVRNMAVSTDSANVHQIFLSDLEDLRLWNVEDPVERNKYLRGVYNDIFTLVGSILGRGLWQDAGHADRSRAMQVIFADPYISFLAHPSNKTDVYDTKLHQEVEDILEKALEQI